MPVETLTAFLKIIKIVWMTLLMLAPMAIIGYGVAVVVTRSIDVRYYRDTVLRLCGQQGLDSLPSYTKMLFSRKAITAANYPVTFAIGQQPL